MSSKNNARATYDVAFDCLVQILVLLVKEGEVGILVPGCLKQELPCDAGYTDGWLKDVHAFLEIKTLELFYSIDKRSDIQIIVPDEEIPKGRYLVIALHFQAIGVIVLRDVGPLQMTVEDLVWRGRGDIELGDVVNHS